MKSSFLITFFAALSLAGFSVGAQAQQGCSGQRVTIHAVQGTGDINVTPMVFNEKKGCGFEIHVPRGRTTHIISDTSWLNGSSSGGPIVISIPAGTPSDSYKYDVDIEDFGRLDPHIRVN